ncbi:MAG: acyltransferase [Candidatus Krumholzibacteriaceae bacterium]|jgi:maltose O-acetyltransferase
MSEIRERSHNSPSGFWKGFLGHCAYYVSWPHTLASWLHQVRGVKIKHPLRVRIAANVLIDSLYPELVEIDDDVFITRGVVIVAHLTPTPFLREFIGGTQFKRVRIGRGAYIGVNAIILPGVTVGEGSIVGAGSVVTKDVPPYSVAVGNPARVIRSVRDGGGEAAR